MRHYFFYESEDACSPELRRAIHIAITKLVSNDYIHIKSYVYRVDQSDKTAILVELSDII